jgi:hypothetical protein
MMARKYKCFFMKVSAEWIWRSENDSNAPEYALFCGGCARFWQHAMAADKPARDDCLEVGGYNSEKT